MVVRLGEEAIFAFLPQVLSGFSLPLTSRTRIFKSLDFVDSVETAETGTSLAASPERPIC